MHQSADMDILNQMMDILDLDTVGKPISRHPGPAGRSYGTVFALVHCKAAVSTSECEYRPDGGLSASANQPTPSNRQVRRVNSAMQSCG